ncbi:MAG: hypothetical protein M1820_005590 [Bogoriella megaspora]|nr:MAG: hypothetical protein M1820_005590 [Bogoriella megaspora]
MSSLPNTHHRRRGEDNAGNDSANQGAAAVPKPPARTSTQTLSGWFQPHDSRAAVHYHTEYKLHEIDSADVLCQQINEDAKQKRNAVCIIEGISDNYINKLTEIRDGFDTCAARYKDRTRQDFDHSQTDETISSVHVDGIFDYHAWKDSHAIVKAFRTPADTDSGEPRDTSTLSTLSRSNAKPWRVPSKAARYPVISANAISYILANSLWDTNLRLLHSCIQHVSFRDLRDPKVETNKEMHDYREALRFLHNSTHEAIKGVPTSPPLSVGFEKMREYYKKRNVIIYNPVEFLQITHDEAENVQNFLMESFQLLMSSISVRESGLSAEQASRTTILTYLAILYLPLTVATGVFGMNIKEINNGSPKFWWVIVVMVILMFLTVIIYFLLKRIEKREKQMTI